ncbi:pyruvate formate lyase family protein [Pelagicoccus mobilis]|uniref:Formate C-acetyltransferase n=1 Tax=Pelagicoccus mobilis TaxID=415221 RepID=A0A934S195_9BACT|nr:pyruvate formate lyase family protein [Pelagicoccus mobilis]MBK1878746.1 hypothetical protein [Pelagicoccus mobilis]
MATDLKISRFGLEYVRAFTEAYRSTDDVFLREHRCEAVQFPATLVSPRKGDLLAGKRVYPEIGYSPQYGGLGYYAMFTEWPTREELSELTEADKEEWSRLRAFWETENTHDKAYESLPPEAKEVLPKTFHNAEQLDLPAYALCRMAGLQLDFRTLLDLGLDGTRELLSEQLGSPVDAKAKAFYEAGLRAIDQAEVCLNHYITEAEQLEPSVERDAMLSTMRRLQNQAPETFHEALQLIQLVTILTGTNNYGRLDVVLGPYLCGDLDSGALSYEHALKLMQNFYTILNEEYFHTDARIMIGGMGRDSEEEADRFAMLAMETTESLNLPLPQLTLRFHVGQNPDLLNKAYDVIGMGKTFPMLYNDSVNVPAVQEAFQVEREEAEQYLPFGCGEYMLYHRSCGTPNAIQNLQLCLESVINHGKSLRTGKRIGPDLGGLDSYSSFDELWGAYEKTIEHFLGPLAKGQEAVYRTTGKECPFTLASLYYDDCIASGRTLFDGGVRYLGGSNETYGNVNTADSLLAIKELVYERSVCTGAELLSALDANWEGNELLQKQARECAKFGNDDARADEMLQRVHRQICLGTAAAGRQTEDLHHFLVVVINNNHNTVWGAQTSASADGRKHGDPLAPGNAPGAGCDQSGLSATLNSQAKPDPNVHAGAVQNVKLSASFPSKNRELYRTLFNTYFKRGGTQAMITVTNRDDLVAALEHPENYANLIVRVGGFSARFIDLDPETQQEILSRTEHG